MDEINEKWLKRVHVNSRTLSPLIERVGEAVADVVGDRFDYESRSAQLLNDAIRFFWGIAYPDLNAGNYASGFFWLSPIVNLFNEQRQLTHYIRSVDNGGFQQEIGAEALGSLERAIDILYHRLNDVK